MLGNGSAFSQQPVFKNYTVREGLPSSEVYQTFQDSKGFMWFCTDAGVSRYDGLVVARITKEESGFVRCRANYLIFLTTAFILSRQMNALPLK